MKKSFVVIGLGRFGFSVVKTLSSLNLDVLAIDNKEERVAQVASFIPECAIADGSKYEVLADLGVSHIDHAVVAIGGNLQASVLAVINLKNLGVKKITVRADEESHIEIYKKLGATEVIIPEDDAAVYLANQIGSESIIDYYELTDDYVMVKVSIGENFTPKSLIELDLRNKYGVNIVGILDGEVFNIPKGTDKLAPGYVIVVVGTKEKIRKFDNYINS